MKKTSTLTFCSLLAALYVLLTLLPALIPGLGSFLFGPIQLRLSEALCVLPALLPASAWGLFVGCLLANLLGMSLGLTSPLDILVGSLATLLAGLMTAKIKRVWLLPLPSVLVNGVLVGGMLAKLLPLGHLPFVPTFLLYFGQVALGEALVGYALGLPLFHLLSSRKIFRRGPGEKK